MLQTIHKIAPNRTSSTITFDISFCTVCCHSKIYNSSTRNRFRKCSKNHCNDHCNQSTYENTKINVFNVLFSIRDTSVNNISSLYWCSENRAANDHNVIYTDSCRNFEYHDRYKSLKRNFFIAFPIFLICDSHVRRSS
jgi:hypothetical protein